MTNQANIFAVSLCSFACNVWNSAPGAISSLAPTRLELSIPSNPISVFSANSRFSCLRACFADRRSSLVIEAVRDENNFTVGCERKVRIQNLHGWLHNHSLHKTMILVIKLNEHYSIIILKLTGCYCRVKPCNELSPAWHMRDEVCREAHQIGALPALMKTSSSFTFIQGTLELKQIKISYNQLLKTKGKDKKQGLLLVYL